MSLANLMEEYKNDVTKELMTDEAKRALALRVEEIQTRAKQEIEMALLEIKEEEKVRIAKCRAVEVARQLEEYKAEGLPDDRAWELVKQEAGMIQWRGSVCA